LVGTAPVKQDGRAYQRATASYRTDCSPVGRGRQTETRRQPWPRASGHFSRTTGVARACTASGCGCGPGQAGRSCRAGVPRVVASSLR